MSTSSSPKQRPSRRAKIAVTAGAVIVSLALAETGASLVHRGAYPYLNVYEADPKFGVRLAPNATTRVRTRSGRITDVRTNALGFRGAEWAKPGEDDRTRVLLLGDSQIFGYNVDERETLASHLDAKGFAVLNAAVPTYGPPDYVLALKELAPKHRPQLVVFVANAANDWFEPVPNQRRTTARDGWATRAGAPATQWFPLRGWLLGRSHLVFGVRQVAHFVGDAQMGSTQGSVRLKTDVAKLRRKTGDRSTITPHLRAAVSACAEIGCQVVAVALPTDVQVSAAEWEKYRAPAVDLHDTEPLLEDFVLDARDLGVPALNLLTTLRAAEPGAFLDDDYHLSPKGHRAVADALSPLLHPAEARR